MCRDCGRQNADSVENARIVKSLTAVPWSVVSVPLISLTASVRATVTRVTSCPLRRSIGVSVMSRPSSSTDFSCQPRNWPAGRIKCAPAGTATILKLLSFSTRACEFCWPGSTDIDEMRSWPTSGGFVCPGGNETVPMIVAPADNVTVMLGMSVPETVTGSVANCGQVASMPRARRT
jgi:hypothetical protein